MKGIGSILVWAVCLALLSACSSNLPLDDAVSGVGDRGYEVCLIQRRLSELGYYTGECDGVFDRDTALAVRRFQLDEGFKGDGVVGESELDALGIYADMPRDVLVPGDSGIDVMRLQRLLRRSGYYFGELSGHYGRLTASAVRNFRRDSGLSDGSFADGRVFGLLGLSGDTARPFDGGGTHHVMLLARFIEALHRSDTGSTLAEMTASAEAVLADCRTQSDLTHAIYLAASSAGVDLTAEPRERSIRAAREALWTYRER